MYKWAFLFVLVWAVAVSAAPKTQRKVLTLVTHEALPFMGEKLREGGALPYGLRVVLDKMNYDVNVIFAPSWPRAKIMAANNPQIDGYFPYATVENEELFSFSKLFIEDPWVIVERRDMPIHWEKFEDLTKYTAGNVSGVELRPGIKELVEQKKLNVETTTTDTYNLLKLATRRVDLVFMDAMVFKYQMATEELLRPYRGKLQVNAKPITITKYGLAVKKTKVSPSFLKEFNKISPEVTRHVEDYLSSLDKAHSTDLSSEKSARRED